MFCGWEGNRRSVVALAMRHRLSGLFTYRLEGQCAGDEHSTYAPPEYCPSLPLYPCLTPPLRGNPSEFITQNQRDGVTCKVNIAQSWLQPFLTDPPVWLTDRRTGDSIQCALYICCHALKNRLQSPFGICQRILISHQRTNKKRVILTQTTGWMWVDMNINDEVYSPLRQYVTTVCVVWSQWCSFVRCCSAASLQVQVHTDINWWRCSKESSCWRHYDSDTSLSVRVPRCQKLQMTA